MWLELCLPISRRIHNMYDPYKVKSTISPNANVDLEDIPQTKQTLKAIGYYNEPGYGMSPYPDREMFRAIEQFQGDFGLRKDGVIKPGGPTERTLRAVTTQAEKQKGDPVSSIVVITDAAVLVNAAVVVDVAVLGHGKNKRGK